MKWIFIICLTFNGITQGNNIERLFIELSKAEHEKHNMQNNIEQLEKDIYNLKAVNNLKKTKQ